MKRNYFEIPSGFRNALVVAFLSLGLMCGSLSIALSDGEVQENLPPVGIVLDVSLDPVTYDTKIESDDLPAFTTLLVGSPLADMGEQTIPGKTDLINYEMLIDGPGSDTLDSVKKIVVPYPGTIDMLSFRLLVGENELRDCSLDHLSQSEIKMDEITKALLSYKILLICGAEVSK